MNELQDLNTAIEQYCLYEQYGSKIKQVDENKENSLNIEKNKILSLVAKRFSYITDATIEKDISTIYEGYRGYFWQILFKFNGDKQITPTTIAKLLNDRKISITSLLQNEKVVKVYSKEIKDYFIKDINCISIMIYEFLSVKDGSRPRYQFPKNFTQEDKISMIERYIDSEEPSLNILSLMYKSNIDRKILPIFPRTKVKIKRRIQKLKDDILNNKSDCLTYKCEVSFCKQDKIISTRTDGLNIYYSYNIEWIYQHLDYLSILNNFIHLFGFVDKSYRWQHISLKSKISATEKALSSEGTRDYPRGEWHKTIECLAHAQMFGYYEILSDAGVNLEDMFLWFFKIYLPKEFHATGFFINIPSGDLLNRCSRIAIEIESILKQFKLYCEDNEVVHDLLIEEDQMVISCIPSKQKNKYIYADKKNTSQIFYNLFSDQSLMLYQPEKDINKTIAYDILRESKVCYTELDDWQKEKVNFLVDHGVLSLDLNSNINFDYKLLSILYELYVHECLCSKYVSDEYATQLELLKEKQLIRYGSTLLSEPEQDYFNYIFNRKSFDNSKDLRNQYAHDTQSLNENDRKNDYITLLRLMVLIIIKIYDDLCLQKKN